MVKCCPLVQSCCIDIHLFERTCFLLAAVLQKFTYNPCTKSKPLILVSFEFISYKYPLSLFSMDARVVGVLGGGQVSHAIPDP